MPSKVKPATGWQRPLAFPIKLRDGHVVETLAQAVALTQRLPKARQLKPVWQHTAALLMEAHASGKSVTLTFSHVMEDIQTANWHNQIPVMPSKQAGRRGAWYTPTALTAATTGVANGYPEE
jgi:hypothetical protein